MNEALTLSPEAWVRWRKINSDAVELFDEIYGYDVPWAAKSGFLDMLGVLCEMLEKCSPAFAAARPDEGLQDNAGNKEKEDKQ